jgi:hypothetical protein
MRPPVRWIEVVVEPDEDKSAEVARLEANGFGLERTTKAGGRDRIDHPRGTHDDVANAAAGALVFAYEELNIRLGSGSRTL